MTIEWLNEHMSEAIVTVGLWRKRQARVRRGGHSWQFVSTGRDVPGSVDRRLERAFSREMRRRREAENAPLEWQPVDAVPTARIVKR